MGAKTHRFVRSFIHSFVQFSSVKIQLVIFQWLVVCNKRKTKKKRVPNKMNECQLDQTLVKILQD